MIPFYVKYPDQSIPETGRRPVGARAQEEREGGEVTVEWVQASSG